jgi:hypothetical protein
MHTLRPDIYQMLDLGEFCGLTYLDEAWGNYLHNYDLFFKIDELDEQYKDFIQQAIDAGLAEVNEEGLYIKPITIIKAKELYNAKFKA